MSRDFAEFLVDGHRVLPALLRDIERAEREIHLSIFLFFRDPIGLEVAEALERRARAGIKVRVILNMQKTAMGDPFSTGEKRMMKNDPNVDYDPLDVKPLCERMTAAGIQVLDSDIDYDRVIEVRDPRLRSIAEQIRGAIDVDVLHIDHRKVIVIDGRVAYSGGANIGAQYLFHVPFDAEKDAREEGDARKANGEAEPWWKWHDSLTRFEGPIATAIDEEFRARWILDGGEPFEPQAPLEIGGRGAGNVVGAAIDEARVLTNAPDGTPNAIRQTYVELIGSATSSIFIENPYLYHPSIVDALCLAKQRRPELRVVLILPSVEHNDNAFAADAQQHCYPRYLACGIEVYEYQNHFNHLKIAVFDERVSPHGSTNLNYRSLEDDKDFELVVRVDDAGLARRVLAECRDEDLRHSRRITADDVNGASFAALRVRVRDPRTLLLLSRRVL